MSTICDTQALGMVGGAQVLVRVMEPTLTVQAGKGGKRRIRETRQTRTERAPAAVT